METAVEWFAQELYEKFEMKGDGKVFDELLGQAKEMEKEQIIDAFVDGADKGEMFNNENRAFTTDALEYYNKTFKSE